MYVFLLASLLANLIYRNHVGTFCHDAKMRKSTKYIIIHHDAVPWDCTFDDVNRTHLQRWNDYFPYTFYIKDGKINQMREIDQQTSHAIGYNENGIGICIHTPDKGSLVSRIELGAVIWYLQIRYDIPRSRVLGHGETVETECPAMDMDSLRLKCLTL